MPSASLFGTGQACDDGGEAIQVLGEIFLNIIRLNPLKGRLEKGTAAPARQAKRLRECVRLVGW